MFQFDKSKCLGNIYHLVKERGLKIGDLEDQAGVSIGYLSRLNKEDNKSTPGIEFLLAVAQVLNVSLEGLLMCDYAELSHDERKSMDFLTKLLTDTQASEILWRKNSRSELFNLEHDDFGDVYATHPLMEPFDDESEPELTTRFVSKYHPDWCAWITECFETYISDDVRLFLVATDFIAFQSEQVKGYELYMQVRGKVVPICYTVENEETPFYPLLNSLITSAKESASHVHLDEDARSAIDSYLGIDQFEFFNDNDVPF